MNYFEVFGLPRLLSIDARQLERSYYELSRRFHPDFFMAGPPEQREHALRMTALLNDAYRALKDPVRRVEHLLEIEGYTIDRAKAPQDLLAEVFEINEQLDAVRSARQAGRAVESLLTNLEQCRASIRRKREWFEARLQATAAEWDLLVRYGAGEMGKKQTLSRMKDIVSQSSYIRNLERDIEGEVSANAANRGN